LEVLAVLEVLGQVLLLELMAETRHFQVLRRLEALEAVDTQELHMELVDLALMVAEVLIHSAVALGLTMLEDQPHLDRKAVEAVELVVLVAVVLQALVVLVELGVSLVALDTVAADLVERVLTIQTQILEQ
jgi:hypothetical protein